MQGFKEVAFNLPNVQLAAQRFGAGPPLMMLHGWMDNAASFRPLAPYLQGFDAVALEHAGHGHSGHRPGGHWYHLMDYVADALAVADRLGWEEFNLLGHSLGGAVASMIAASAPRRIRKLAVIEGLGPMAGDARHIGQRLQRSWEQLSNINPDRLRRYESVEQAVKARLTKSRLSVATARLLVERGIRQEDAHWVWRSDPRLNITTPYRFDESQILHMIAAIECPTLVVMSKPTTPLIPESDMQRRFAALRRGRYLAQAGGHHLHMIQPANLAPHLVEHFTS